MNLASNCNVCAPRAPPSSRDGCAQWDQFPALAVLIDKYSFVVIITHGRGLNSDGHIRVYNDALAKFISAAHMRDLRLGFGVKSPYLALIVIRRVLPPAWAVPGGGRVGGRGVDCNATGGRRCSAAV